MRRASVLVLLAFLVTACASGPTNPPGGATPPAGQTPAGANETPAPVGGGGPSLVEAAAKVKDACLLMPLDLAARIVPNASAPQSWPLPPQCTVTNGVQVLQITIGAHDAVDPLDPAERISGLAEAAYLQRQVPDDAYLKVTLSRDEGAIYVEVAGHDGKDHKDDAIAVAKAVLALLR